MAYIPPNRQRTGAMQDFLDANQVFKSMKKPDALVRPSSVRSAPRHVDPNTGMKDRRSGFAKGLSRFSRIASTTLRAGLGAAFPAKTGAGIGGGPLRIFTRSIMKPGKPKSKKSLTIPTTYSPRGSH